MLAAALSSHVSASNAVCDTPTPIADFNPARYMGTWFEISRVPYLPFQPASKTCTEAQYYDLVNGTFTVLNSDQDKYYDVPRKFAQGTGTASSTPGWFYVQFGGPKTSVPNYQVIATDYDSYSIVYGCTPAQESPDLWYLSRSPLVDANFITNMNAKAAAQLPGFNFSTM